MGAGEFDYHPESNTGKNSDRSAVDWSRRATTIWQRLHGKGGGTRLRTIGKIYRGPCKPGYFDLEPCNWELRELPRSLLHGPVGGLVHGLHFCASLHHVRSREIGRTPFDAAAEVDGAWFNSVEICELHVNRLAGNGNLCGLKLQLVI